MSPHHPTSGDSSQQPERVRAERPTTERPSSERPSTPPAAWRTLAGLHGDGDATSQWTGNPVHESPPPIERWPTGRVVVWSGSLSETAPFAEDLRNWMPAGRDALEAWCDRLVGPLATAGRVMLIRPHARQLLSDVAGIVRFLRRHRGERFGMAVAPLDLLTEEMRPDAAEHLRRTFEVLEPLLDPDRDVLIAPGAAISGEAADRSRERCEHATRHTRFEVVVDTA